MADLWITRAADSARLRRIKVCVDGEVVAKLRWGARVRLGTWSGMRRVHVEMDWLRSTPLDVELDGEDVELGCGWYRPELQDLSPDGASNGLLLKVVGEDFGGPA